MLHLYFHFIACFGSRANRGLSFPSLPFLPHTSTLNKCYSVSDTLQRGRWGGRQNKQSLCPSLWRKYLQRAAGWKNNFRWAGSSFWDLWVETLSYCWRSSRDPWEALLRHFPNEQVQGSLKGDLVIYIPNVFYGWFGVFDAHKLPKPSHFYIALYFKKYYTISQKSPSFMLTCG